MQRLSEEDAMATAIATATVAASLTTTQQAAREFWRQAGADGMPPFYVMSQYYEQLSANSDNLPAVTAALEQLLTGLGYATDVDTVFAELAAGQGEELGYWAGRYCLFDSDGNRFDLVVGRNGATLTVPPALVDVTALPAGADMASVTVLSSGGSFSDGTLQLANAQFQASLSFTLPISDASFDTTDPAAAMFQSTAPRCIGKFGVVGGAAGSRAVSGKRGAWTSAGVTQAADGDPAAAWYGQYVLLDVTDVTAVKQQPDLVNIYNDPNFGLTFQWGNIYGSNVTYNNNVLQCANEDDDTTQYAMQFVAPQVEAAEINLAVITAGVVRSYKGYWVDRYLPPSPVSQVNLAKRPMIAAVNTSAAGASGDGHSQVIDVSSLTANGKTPIELPHGAVGNTYALTLNLTGSGATDKFSWTITNDPTGRAAIAPSGGTTVQFSLANLSDSDQGKQLQVTVQLTNTSAAPPVSYTLLFQIVVSQCDPISLAPTVLMPVTVGAAYTQNLVAHGAYDNFTWSVTPSLPPGLTWDDNSHQLSGTVTDATQVGKAFSLEVRLAAPDVIMDPLTVSLGITVQSAPAVASGMDPWERILIGSMTASGVVMAALAAFALNRYKAAKANAKTAEAAKTGNTSVENTTKGDPKSVSKSIIEVEKTTVPVVELNIPYDQSLIDGITKMQKELSTEIKADQTIVSKLAEYLQGHKRDNADAAVNDDELAKEGYETIGEAVLGLGELQKSVAAKMERLSTVTQWSNQIQTKTAADQNKVVETANGERNTAILIDQ
jgi:hypothetical protein